MVADFPQKRILQPSASALQRQTCNLQHLYLFFTELFPSRQGSPPSAGVSLLPFPSSSYRTLLLRSFTGRLLLYRLAPLARLCHFRNSTSFDNADLTAPLPLIENYPCRLLRIRLDSFYNFVLSFDPVHRPRHIRFSTTLLLSFPPAHLVLC